MILRAATVDDLDAICAIEEASFSDPWSREDFEAAFENPICSFHVAEDGGEVVGYALFSLLYEDAEIMSLAVAPSKRRGGVGRAMLRRVVECASIGEAQTVFLEVRASNEAAIALYGGIGFEPIAVRKKYYRRPTEDAIVMALDIADKTKSPGLL